MVKVKILPEVHAEIMFHVMKATIEISGLGRIERADDGTMIVTKVYLLNQENGAASTDISAEAVADLLYTSRADKGDLNFWWHSHVDMPTFWSNTDMNTIREFGSKGYLLSTVFNRKGSHRTSYFQGSNGFLPEIFVDDIHTEFTYTPTKAQVEAWTKEHDEKCKRIAPKHILGTGLMGKPSWFDRDKVLNKHMGDAPSFYDDPDFYTVPKDKPEMLTKNGVPVERYSGLNDEDLADQVSQLLYSRMLDEDNLTVFEEYCLWDFYEYLTDEEVMDTPQVVNYFTKMTLVELEQGLITLISQGDTNEPESKPAATIHRQPTSTATKLPEPRGNSLKDCATQQPKAKGGARRGRKPKVSSIGTMPTNSDYRGAARGFKK